MFESGWGFQEIILIMIIALIVVGPERLPDLARKAGKWFAKIRRFVTDVKEDIDREIAADELKKILKDQVDSSGVHEIIEETKQTFSDVENEYALKALDDDQSKKTETDTNDKKSTESKPATTADNPANKKDPKASNTQTNTPVESQKQQNLKTDANESLTQAEKQAGAQVTASDDHEKQTASDPTKQSNPLS